MSDDFYILIASGLGLLGLIVMSLLLLKFSAAVKKQTRSDDQPASHDSADK